MGRFRDLKLVAGSERDRSAVGAQSAKPGTMNTAAARNAAFLTVGQARVAHGGRAVDGRHRRTTLSVVGRRCGNVVTPSSPRWQREVIPAVRRVQRLRGPRSPSSAGLEPRTRRQPRQVAKIGNVHYGGSVHYPLRVPGRCHPLPHFVRGQNVNTKYQI